MVREPLFVRVPVDVRTELERICDTHGVSMASVVSRALSVYLVEHCGAELDVALPA